jgi:hypothetical protein
VIVSPVFNRQTSSALLNMFEHLPARGLACVGGGTWSFAAVHRPL